MGNKKFTVLNLNQVYGDNKLDVFNKYGSDAEVTEYAISRGTDYYPLKGKYLKGKGIRDLYLIKIARVGTRKEGQPDNDPNDFRLVFELEFVDELFDTYQPIHLNIWQSFTDTNMTELFSKINKQQE